MIRFNALLAIIIIIGAGALTACNSRIEEPERVEANAPTTLKSLQQAADEAAAEAAKDSGMQAPPAENPAEAATANNGT